MRSKGIQRLVLGILLCIIPVCVYLNGESSYKFFKSIYHHPAQQVSSRCGCPKCLANDDPLFLGRFKKSLNPFLTRTENLSHGDYRWWTSIQFDRHDYSYNKVTKELFNFFKDNVDFMDSSPARCRTCAVVGNSGNLQNSHYGQLIDEHDVIIRMNGARVKGYEVDVGQRTTLHVMYPESAIDLANDTYLVLFPYKVTDLRWLLSAFTTGTVTHTYQPVKARIKANKDLVKILNPAFMKYVHEIWLERKGRYPSTGFLAFMLAMHICDEVNVFGFGADRNGNWNHYWEELKVKNLKTGVHGGMNEYEILLKLSENDKISFFKGW